MNKLIFVYNANSGLGNALLDYGKKYVQPQKYDCQLCMVTYGPFGMKKDWREFVRLLPYDVYFLHKNEYEKKYPENKITYPAVLEIKGHDVLVKIKTEEFDSIKSLDDLMQKFK